MRSDTTTTVYAIQMTYPSGDTKAKMAVPYYALSEATTAAELFTSLAGRTSPTGTTLRVLEHPDPARGRA